MVRIQSVHVDLVQYLAVRMFFPFPSAAIELYSALEDDKLDDSYVQIRSSTESETCHI